MNDVLNAAMRRAVLLAGLTGAASLIASRQQGLSWEESIYAGLAVLITALIARMGLEGGYDSNRAANNNLNKGDVPVAAPDVTVTPAPPVVP